MKLKYIPALMLFIVGIACLIAYRIIGAKVGIDGSLVEPFYLIPIGYLFVGIGIVISLASGIVSFTRKTKKSFK
ncbi:DUF3955 domain-containing protein [Paenibacillus albiflavus]|uniref:DUF3955 domain-containing protein n=1 Tax=Paenibacillus albiflavus TaxID=2545760 RepID=A0A4R4EQP9_9BACL|nr:DUF3955 domain-containing protein [Paenibacillus albiflavus]TCZ80738.1 DUF3955 domain-containing protein [Paenibacillus albiflavus]